MTKTWQRQKLCHNKDMTWIVNLCEIRSDCWAFLNFYTFHWALNTVQWTVTFIWSWVHFPFIITGTLVDNSRYKKDESWKAAVTTDKIVDKTNKIVDGSQCCHLCREKYPETKVFQKFKRYSICECHTFDDDFDPSEHELKHGAYQIGSCE